MTQTLPGFGSPSAGFDEPFAMLAACHERIEAMLAILERLPAHLSARGADREAQAAAQRVLRYFDEAGPKHHADEETDLFPLLEAQGRFAALLPELRAEHRTMEAFYSELRPALSAIASATGRDLRADIAERFCSLYRAHIARENAELLPAAEESVSSGQLRDLGLAMAARRRDRK